MGQPITIDGVLYEDLGNGQLKVVGYADAPGAPTAVPLPINPVRAAKEAQDRARQIEADQRSTEANDRAREANDRSRREWEATHNPDGSPKNKSTNKPMRQGDADHLEKQLNAYSYLKNAVAGFQDDYAGNTLTGGLENFAQRRVSSVGTPGQADWWANFKTIDNLIRNELFGASLTTGEKAAYAETTIDPSMDPKIIRQNLARREQIAREALARRVQRLHSVYNPEEVEASLGELKGDLLAGKAQQQADNEVPDPSTGADLKPPHNDPSPDDLPPPNDPERAIATGNVREDYSARLSAQVDAMINAGASMATINAVLKKSNYPSINAGDLARAQRWMKDNPGQRYHGATITRQQPTTLLERAAASPLAAGVARYTNAATAGTVGALAGEQGQGALDAMGATHKKASLAGDLLGGVTGALGLEAGLAGRASARLAPYAPRAADALFGGLSGFNQAQDGEGAWDAGKGAFAGLAGGFLGERALRGVGRITQGVRNPQVQYLRDQGIPLTVGQTVGDSGRLGATIKNVEDAITSVPGLSSIVNARRTEGLEAFNRAAMQQAGAPAGIPVTAHGAQGMEQLRSGIGPAYDNALGGAQIDANDPAFLEAVEGLVQASNRIPPVGGAREAAAASIENRIGGATNPDTGIMTGRGFQEAYRGLGRTARERAAGDYGHEVGQVMRQGQNVLADALDAQNPGALEAFRNANAVNRNANVIAQALNAAKNQGDELFTPAQMNTADALSTRRLEGPMASAAGDRPFFDLARAGQQVLPSRLPDSGTATRGLVGATLVGGVGGAGLGSTVGEADTGAKLGLGATLLLAAGGSRPAQRAITTLLTERPDALTRAGQRFIDNSGIGGWTGAGVLTPLLVGQ